MIRKIMPMLLLPLCAACAGTPAQTANAQQPAKTEYTAPQNPEITIEKPYIKWLFAGFGFQNSEAEFTAVMDDEFLNQRALKSFREISPTFARVYAGFANVSKEQMDRFADYYHKTFKLADTTLYVTAGTMPAFADELNVDEYAESTAKNLAYLIKEKDCRKIRYFCITNELGSGDLSGYFARFNKMDLFKKINVAMYKAFRRHGLDIEILATDIPATTKPYNVLPSIQWAIDNMNEYVGAYCTHWYVYGRRADDLGLWDEYKKYFDTLVQTALKKNKRYILGEWGFNPVFPKRGVMIDDLGSPHRQPETAAESALAMLEVGVAAMNAGAYACVDWSFTDYPDPLVIVDGHTPKDRAIYESYKCGYKMDMKYNKWGIFRWDRADKNYSSYPEMYAIGYLAKLFKKNSSVLPSGSNDFMLRPGSVLNPDGSMSIVVVNRGGEKRVKISSQQAFCKDLRMYVYEADNVPFSEFNDLQPHKCVIKPDTKNSFTVKLPARSACFFTTDYTDRTPSPIAAPTLEGGVLRWQASPDKEHCYYRVFKDGKQIASTVATYLKIDGGGAGAYSVKSVDKWGNCGK